ncbi:hypothetical protein Q3G72_005198 [Acer saccharum]|nr:hypothetical protein Q3G72_005198 [Acer saccharum]
MGIEKFSSGYYGSRYVVTIVVVKYPDGTAGSDRPLTCSVASGERIVVVDIAVSFGKDSSISGTSRFCLGKFIRLLFNIDVSQPLKRALKVSLDGTRLSRTISLHLSGSPLLGHLNDLEMAFVKANTGFDMEAQSRKNVKVCVDPKSGIVEGKDRIPESTREEDRSREDEDLNPEGVSSTEDDSRLVEEVDLIARGHHVPEKEATGGGNSEAVTLIESSKGGDMVPEVVEMEEGEANFSVVYPGRVSVKKASSNLIPEVGKSRRTDQGIFEESFGFKEGEVGNVLSVHDRSMKRIGRKKNHLAKRHGMITRYSKDLNQDFGKENRIPKVKKTSWNLKEEIAKVIKAGVELGFDFKGREKDMVEEIVRRIKAGTFGKLEGILPYSNN